MSTVLQLEAEISRLGIGDEQDDTETKFKGVEALKGNGEGSEESGDKEDKKLEEPKGVESAILLEPQDTQPAAVREEELETLPIPKTETQLASLPPAASTAPNRQGLFPTVDEVPDQKIHGYILRILINEKRPILLVGESTTLSMPLALARMRGAFEGIYASHEPGEDRVVPQDGLKKETMTIIGGEGAGDFDEIAWRRLTMEIDARSMEMDHTVPEYPTSIIWFNFPWTYPRASIAKLLQEFFLSADRVQGPAGGIILIGMTERGKYRGSYEQENLETTAKKAGYKHYKDSEFLQKCSAKGYQIYSLALPYGRTQKEFHQYVVPVAKLHVFVREGELIESNI